MNHREIWSVYSLYDRNLVCLYVGWSHQVRTRLRQHETQRAWWCNVAFAGFDHFTDKDESIARERELIRRLRPTYCRSAPNFGQVRPRGERVHCAIYSIDDVGPAFEALAFLARERVVRPSCPVKPRRPTGSRGLLATVAAL